MSEQEQPRKQPNVFAKELAAARKKASLTQDALAALVHFSASTIANVEASIRAPSLPFAQALDKFFETPADDEGKGTFERLYDTMRNMPFPAWFRPFAELEARAGELRLWEHSVFPGLLQTEDYARALLSVRMGPSEDGVDESVMGRMERQAVLTRSEPPLVWVLLDEGALRRPVGGRPVMLAQLEHAVDMAQRPNVVVQVVPVDVGAHDGVNGAFVIADFARAPSVAYLETALSGIVIDQPDQVASMRVTYDTIRGEAISARASLELLREVAKEWT